MDVLAVRGADLLTHGSQHSHAEFPVLEFIARTFILVLSLSNGLFENALDLLGPFTEDGHEIVHHVGVNLVSVVNGLHVLLVSFVIGFERDVAVLGLNSFL